MTITRRQAREWAVQMLTAADLNPPDDIDGFITESWAEIDEIPSEEGGCDGHIHGRMMKFTEERVRGVIDAVKDIDEVLVRLLDNWDLYRLGTIERVVLRLGVWEIRNNVAPIPVIINEAIDIANWFSSPKSRSLINGILDRYAKEKPAV